MEPSVISGDNCWSFSDLVKTSAVGDGCYNLKMFTNVPVPFLLTRKEDYEYWKKCMATYLESENLWRVIERAKIGDAKDSWRKIDSKALHAIQVSCSREILDPILTDECSISADESSISADERSISIEESLTSFKKEGTSTKKGSPSAKEVWNCLEDWAHNSRKEEGEEYTKYNRLFKALSVGNWDDIEDFLKDHHEALTAKISNGGDTLLIAAVTAGHADVVKKLVNQMSEEDLEAIDINGYTALAAAAQGGINEIAKILVTKNRELLNIFEKKKKKNPLIIASENGHEEMTRYLYKQTRIEDLQDKALVDVLNNCISHGTLSDIALDILQRRPQLLETPFDEKHSPLVVLSQIPSAFPSSYGLSFWQKLLCHCIPVQSKNNASRNTHGDIESPNVVSTYRKSTGTISADVSKFENFGVYTSMFKAIKYGIKEEVKKIAQPRYIFKRNTDGKVPTSLFTDQHKDLAKEGEQWAKGVASSCSVVATLIASMMFSVAFAVPGGIKSETGQPLLFNNNLFPVFIISDALSLFSSAISALVFLGILTSRYSEEAFLKTLPTTLIIGLGTLFFSVVTMMVVYGTTLLIMLQGNWGWVSLPVVLFACGPVFLYVLYQFPLLLEILMSTYGNSIFHHPIKK
ncbi:hypothetical protein LguiA_013499 [Lonicera macranthoides]